MKKIKIIKNGVVTNINANTQMSDAEKDVWLAQEIANNSFGLPERWVNGLELSDEEKASALESREVDNGIGEKTVEYKLPSQFEIVIEDMTEEINQKIAKEERLQALKDKHKAMKNSDLDTIVELRQAVLELQEILGLK